MDNVYALKHFINQGSQYSTGKYHYNGYQEFWFVVFFFFLRRFDLDYFFWDISGIAVNGIVLMLTAISFPYIIALLKYMAYHIEYVIEDISLPISGVDITY